MKNIDFTKIDKKKAELSVGLIKPFLLYLEYKYNRKFLEEFIAETDMDLEFLENSGNWISFEYYTKFLEKIVQFTGSQRVFNEAAKYILTGKTFGLLSPLLIVTKFFGHPGMAYKQLGKIGGAINNVGKYSVLLLSKRKVLVKCTTFPGYKQTKYNCNTMKSFFSVVPCFWNLPAAKVRELQCAVRSGDTCVYEISWIPRPISTFLFAFISSFVLAAEIVYFFLQKNNLFKLDYIFFTVFGLFIYYLLRRIFHYKNMIKEIQEVQELRTTDLERAIANSKREYMELREANVQIIEKANKLSILNYISEEISKIDSEEELLFLIIKILIDCIGFERGYFFCFNSNFTLVDEPGFFDKVTHKKQKKPDLGTNLKNHSVIQSIFTDRRPQVLSSSRIFENEGKNDEILVIPLSIHKIFFYLVIFDNASSGQNIKEKNLQFFATVGRQLEIALNNIYATKAAHNVLSSIPSTIVVFDRNSLKISYVNTAYLRRFQVTKKQVLGENVLSVLEIPEHYKEKFLSQVENIQMIDFIHDQEFQTGLRIIGYTIFKMPEGIGGKNEIGIIMKDITKQKDLQEQLIRGEKLAALGTLASGIAHEINNPLYGILGTAEVIVDESKSEEVKDLAKEIIDFTMQCSDIVKDLSAYSRSLREEKKMEIDVNNILDETIRIIRYSPQFINIEIKKEFDNIPVLYALGGEIRQIFMNIINNAIQAMQGRGKLVISTHFVDGFIQILIKDTGPGIPRNLLSKIFDPFFTTKATGEGTGIGLNIVYRLVTKYNGFISVNSEKGEGAEFIIKFPAKVKEPA
ncbi:MAG: GHKL domain-containing protein [Spirochaetales bacterium]|nr:GHKL domain-containing protein [Spirochaetales bacterium]